MIDTHCHLDHHRFDADRDEVIARALAAGVMIIVNPGTDLVSSRRALDLANRHGCVYAAVGVHPNNCAEFDEDACRGLRELARHPKVVAIGEIGLDYYWDRVPPDQQKRALRAQLALAGELNLPVILHSRNSNADLLCEIAQWDGTIRKKLGADAIVGVWHAFSGDLAEASDAYACGLVLGLGGPVTFQNARTLRALVPSLRPDLLVLETDAPYLTPHPSRGQRNEPTYVPQIARALAELLGLTADGLAAQTDITARRCFGELSADAGTDTQGR